jgi:hypothetical protein
VNDKPVDKASGIAANKTKNKRVEPSGAKVRAAADGKPGEPSSVPASAGAQPPVGPPAGTVGQLLGGEQNLAMGRDKTTESQDCLFSENQLAQMKAAAASEVKVASSKAIVMRGTTVARAPKDGKVDSSKCAGREP